MEKHLLVAVSDQLSAMYGIRFVGRFFSNKDGIKLTLFYTTPKLLESFDLEDTHEAEIHSKKQAVKYEAKGQQALEAARKDLIKMGFRNEQVDSKLHVRKISKVMDLIHEAEKGLYDAVVLGRRGLTWLEAAFEDSVSKGLLEKSLTFPLWFCRKSEPDQKNVLLCVDGSDAAYRMADHVGFILGNTRDHEITVFMATKPKKGDTERIESILSKSIGLLSHHGISREMIRTRVVVSHNVAETILEEAEKGPFAAVALGRRKAAQGFLKELFGGSVSSKLFRGLEQPALWICH